MSRRVQASSDRGSPKFHYDAWVELSTKVVDGPDKLWNTLAHELCHVAAWLIHKTSKPPHGKVFRYWAQKIERSFPSLVKVQTCHSYEIDYKFKYQCSDTNCALMFVLSW